MNAPFLSSRVQWVLAVFAVFLVLACARGHKKWCLPVAPIHTSSQYDDACSRVHGARVFALFAFSVRGVRVLVLFVRIFLCLQCLRCSPRRRVPVFKKLRKLNALATWTLILGPPGHHACRPTYNHRCCEIWRFQCHGWMLRAMDGCCAKSISMATPLWPFCRRCLQLY